MSTITRNKHIIDAADQSVGRISTKIALLLRGKNKPEFDPAKDMGDIVTVMNVKKLKFTGKKLEQREYHHYSGHPGGLKSKTMGEVYAKNPGEVLHRAVRDMLPANRLRTGMLKRLIIK
jgi:large subunit ribosomal protein L13